MYEIFGFIFTWHQQELVVGQQPDNARLTNESVLRVSDLYCALALDQSIVAGAWEAHIGIFSKSTVIWPPGTALTWEGLSSFYVVC